MIEVRADKGDTDFVWRIEKSNVSEFRTINGVTVRTDKPFRSSADALVFVHNRVRAKAARGYNHSPIPRIVANAKVTAKAVMPDTPSVWYRCKRWCLNLVGK